MRAGTTIRDRTNARGRGDSWFLNVWALVGRLPACQLRQTREHEYLKFGLAPPTCQVLLQN